MAQRLSQTDPTQVSDAAPRPSSGTACQGARNAETMATVAPTTDPTTSWWSFEAGFSATGSSWSVAAPMWVTEVRRK